MAGVSEVRTEIPGPKSKALIERWHQAEADKTGFQAPVAIKKGRGSILEDVDGNRFIDWTSGVLVTNVGHCHPRLVKAIIETADTVLNAYEYPTPQRVKASEDLVRRAPDHLNRCFFLCTGAEATESAVRIMKKHTGNYEIIGFYGGFHGRTHNAASVGGMIKPKRRYGPTVPGVIRLPYPYCYRCPLKASKESCGMLCLEFYNEAVGANTTGSLAGLIVEPYLGTAGFIFPPDGWLTALEKWIRERNLLFTLDEVQSSFGRTGTMWAMDWEHITPDIVAVGKGIGSGVTTSAILMRESMLKYLDPGDLGSTNGGNPLSAAACSAVLEILYDEDLITNAEKIGGMMKDRLRGMMDTIPILGDVRGRGLVLGLELVKDRKTKEPAPDLAKKLVLQCAELGLLIGIVGTYGNVIRVAPPLVISEAEARESLDIMEKALRKVSADY